MAASSECAAGTCWRVLTRSPFPAAIADVGTTRVVDTFGGTGPPFSGRPSSPVDVGAMGQPEGSPLSSILAAVAALRLHKREPAALERALQQLASLASADIGCRNAAADAGGAEGVVDALRAHTATGVLRWGCAALWSMSLTLESAVKVVDAGGIQARSLTPRRAPYAWISASHTVNTRNEPNTVTLPASTLLANALARSHQAIIRVIDAPESTRAVVEQACGALAALADAADDR